MHSYPKGTKYLGGKQRKARDSGGFGVLLKGVYTEHVITGVSAALHVSVYTRVRQEHLRVTRELMSLRGKFEKEIKFILCAVFSSM